VVVDSGLFPDQQPGEISSTPHSYKAQWDGKVRTSDSQTTLDELVQHSPADWSAGLIGQRYRAAPHAAFFAEHGQIDPGSGCGIETDSPLEEDGFELVWGLSCQAVVLGCADSFLFGAGKAVFRPGIRFAERAEGAKGPKRYQSLAACRLASLVFRSALTPEHAERR
jgi:hypothetical protein